MINTIMIMEFTHRFLKIRLWRLRLHSIPIRNVTLVIIRQAVTGMVSATTLGRPPLSLHASCTLTPNTGIVRLGLEVPPKRSFN